jgi:hypothetical protein
LGTVSIPNADTPGSNPGWRAEFNSKGKTNMEQIKNQGAQGDVLFVSVSEIPKSAVPEAPKDGKVIVAHSETGHHHTVDGTDVLMFREPSDPFTCYLSIAGKGAEVVHHRPFDTHETIALSAGIWMARRQREYIPAGQRMVVD